MHTPEEEFYVFLRFAEADLLEAIRLLRHIDSVSEELSKDALIKLATISYCRPFKASKGVFNKRLKLNEELVPACSAELHRTLIDLRDQTFAHTDVDITQAVLHCWTKQKTPIFPIQFRPQPYVHLMSNTDAIMALFDAVHESIRARQHEMESVFLKQLPDRPDLQ